MEPDPPQRLALALDAAGVHPVAEPMSIESHSNDTWFIEDAQVGKAVLRIGWRGDTDRLLREGTVAAGLPLAVGYPDMLGFGRVAGSVDLTWTLTRRLDGTSLGEAWPALDGSERRQACKDVASMMRALHLWRPMLATRAALVPRALGPDPSATTAIGRSINPLPDGVPALIQEARRRGIDGDLLDDVERYIDSNAHLCPALDDPALPTVAHSDLHLHNIWWNRGVCGLIDFEWVRLGPPWIDVVRIADNADADDIDGIVEHQVLLRYLRDDYPDLFDVDRFADRVRFMQVAYQVRESLLWGLPEVGDDVAPDHPVRMLRHLLGV